MLAVHFGAGNIGRGFIGQLLHDAGYEVCFVDVNKELVDEINSRKEYTIVLAEEGTQEILIQGVQAIHGMEEEQVAAAIAKANLVTTAVGPTILARIAPVIAKGIALRQQTNPSILNIIACENMISGSTQLKGFVYQELNETEQAFAAQLIGFPDAAVDRIVPMQTHEDKLRVMVEPFYEWVVNQSQFVGPIPTIGGVTFVDDLHPYIERKLFTVNTGHALIAYLGYYMGHETIDEALQNDYILQVSEKALQESGDFLIKKHGFDRDAHLKYIQKILNRFRNPYISDSVARVGRSPIRKLSPHDRLISPANQALSFEIEPIHLALGIAAALQFNHSDDQEAQEIASCLSTKGIEETLTTYSGVHKDSPLFSLILNQMDVLKQSRTSLQADISA